MNWKLGIWKNLKGSGHDRIQVIFKTFFFVGAEEYQRNLTITRVHVEM